MKLKVKICGITNIEDSLAAVEAGADYLGFLFYPHSPRYISAEAAAGVIAQLPPEVKKVGVFVNAPLARIREIAKRCKLDVIQLHGDEDNKTILELVKEYEVWKALPVNDDAAVEQAINCPADAVLADAISPDVRGGTGRVCDWDNAARVAAARKLILAGGINAANVIAAVRQVKPFAVDLSSAVESAPGKKDKNKIQEFFQTARKLK